LGSKESGNSEYLSDAHSLLGQAVAEIRALSYLLHPPMMDEVGLFAAARWYVDGFAERTRIQASCELPPTMERLPDTIELAIFRILQEALENVHRHSGATRAAVLLLQDPDQIVLMVNDNGTGIEPEILQRFGQTGVGSGVGLAGMRERTRELGGSFQIASVPGDASVRVSVPISRTA
jgi:signal transduction histidine kinase